MLVIEKLLKEVPLTLAVIWTKSRRPEAKNGDVLESGVLKAGSWSGIVHLAGDASRPSMARSSSASCLEKPLARQTTPDHLPTCITFLAGSGKAKSKAENKARAWVRMLFLVFWFILLTLDSAREAKYRRECWVDWFIWMGGSYK